MESKYQKGQRVEYVARNKCTYNGNRISGLWRHHVGYVKQVRRTLFGTRYVIIVAKSDEIHFVRSRDIIGTVEDRENHTNQTNKPSWKSKEE